MHKHDSIRLRQMLDAAREALGFAQGCSRPDLDRDRIVTRRTRHPLPHTQALDEIATELCLDP